MNPKHSQTGFKPEKKIEEPEDDTNPAFHLFVIFKMNLEKALAAAKKTIEKNETAPNATFAAETWNKLVLEFREYFIREIASGGFMKVRYPIEAKQVHLLATRWHVNKLVLDAFAHDNGEMPYFERVHIQSEFFIEVEFENLFQVLTRYQVFVKAEEEKQVLTHQTLLDSFFSAYVKQAEGNTGVYEYEIWMGWTVFVYDTVRAHKTVLPIETYVSKKVFLGELEKRGWEKTTQNRLVFYPGRQLVTTGNLPKIGHQFEKSAAVAHPGPGSI